MDCARHCPQCGLDSERTQNGRLPPWELAKALAFHTVIDAVCDHLGQAAPELLGKRCDAYIAEQLSLVGGGHPTARAVRAIAEGGEGIPGGRVIRSGQQAGGSRASGSLAGDSRAGRSRRDANYIRF